MYITKTAIAWHWVVCTQRQPPRIGGPTRLGACRATKLPISLMDRNYYIYIHKLSHCPSKPRVRTGGPLGTRLDNRLMCCFIGSRATVWASDSTRKTSDTFGAILLSLKQSTTAHDCYETAVPNWLMPSDVPMWCPRGTHLVHQCFSNIGLRIEMEVDRLAWSTLQE